MLRILLIGPLPPPIHGTTVMFQQITRELEKRHGVKICVIDTSRKKSEFGCLENAVVAVRTTVKLLWFVTRVQVLTFHASATAALGFSPVVHSISRLFKKPWVLRILGGNVDMVYKRSSRWARAIYRKTALAADLCLFETRLLMKYFENICSSEPKFFWNSREMPTLKSLNEHRTVCRKFVYIGNVKYSKGLKEIIAAGEQLSRNYIVDVFGPFQEGMSERDFDGLNIVKYRGLLHPDDVVEKLKAYDALLLPTYYEGEGYPGVILEAYAACIPVIASNWRSIPEIVDESSGILIEPKNTQMLLAAMKRLTSDQKFYRLLKRGVLEKRKLFSVEQRVSAFIEYCNKLISRRVKL
ncbi:hypothetical protein AMJ83_10120 [candidate division WOR_3 bacterium SM23_42]|uniref:Glycosyl transferase family 1 domain-containing protein n=1 Tax=candidate division WOR_3 bacterium SM23_42 TaxID=1703779 RepID=A0A0S8FTD3_UNCW3|nr:MAG: hypothetical protein AMJ83_10120 [candidate division WOR_3 bacterium SM23_42]